MLGSPLWVKITTQIFALDPKYLKPVRDILRNLDVIADTDDEAITYDVPENYVAPSPSKNEEKPASASEDEEEEEKPATPPPKQKKAAVSRKRKRAASPVFTTTVNKRKRTRYVEVDVVEEFVNSDMSETEDEAD